MCLLFARLCLPLLLSSLSLSPSPGSSFVLSPCGAFRKPGSSPHAGRKGSCRQSTNRPWTESFHLHLHHQSIISHQPHHHHTGRTNAFLHLRPLTLLRALELLSRQAVKPVPHGIPNSSALKTEARSPERRARRYCTEYQSDSTRLLGRTRRRESLRQSGVESWTQDWNCANH